MKNTERLQKTAKSISSAIKVIRIIIIVLASLSLALCLCFIVLGATRAFTKIYELYPLELGKISVNFVTDDFAFMKISKEFTLDYIYQQGQLDYLAYELALKCFIGAIQVGVLIFILSYIKPIFDKLGESETPFTPEIKKSLKCTFIAITIFTILESVLAGLIVGGLLACIYFMFLYGCELQVNEDTTL